MKLTVLGCWAPYARANGACSGYLVQGEETNLLLDCGNGVFGKLQEAVDFRKLDAVIISHLHPDHFADLFSLRHALKGSFWDGSRDAKLDLYLPGEETEYSFLLQKFSDAFNIYYTEQFTNVEIGEFKVSFFSTVHLLPCWGSVVRGSTGTLVYSADTAWDDRYRQIWQGADLLLCEASGLEKDREYARGAHLTAGQAGQLAAAAAVKRLLLTHFYPEYDLAVLKQEAARYYQEVELVHEGAGYFV
ncbi:MAG: MBL fold metallo-hydrolase [Thermoanaerobacteraceae bacterium]|nr:MBL fold metallo-hydrolase [Thermoanaerobacteraceae bacterium]